MLLLAIFCSPTWLLKPNCHWALKGSSANLVSCLSDCNWSARLIFFNFIMSTPTLVFSPTSMDLPPLGPFLGGVRGL